MESYHNPVLARTDCCGLGLQLYPKMSYEAVPYTGTKAEDDWGLPLDGKPLKR